MVDIFLIDRETRDRGRTTKYPYFSPLFGHIIFCIFLVNQYIKFYLSSWRTCTSHTFVFLSRTCHVGFVRYMWGFIYLRFYCRPYGVFQKSPKRIRFHSRPYWLFQKSPKRIRFHSRPYWYMNPHIYLTKPTWQVLDRKTKVCDVQVLQLDK
jgi:hypothetical protein